MFTSFGAFRMSQMPAEFVLYFFAFLLFRKDQRKTKQENTTGC
jgi:hypothetical protein